MKLIFLQLEQLLKGKNNLMKSKDKNKKNTQNKTAKILVPAALFAAVAILLIMSPVFNIIHVEVYGNSYYSEERIKEAAAIQTNLNGFKNIGPGFENIISLRYNSIENSLLKKLSYIDEVVVKYILPDTVSINIIERVPVFLIKYMELYLVIDNNGYVADTIENPAVFPLPVLKGMDVDSFKLGHAIETNDMELFSYAVEFVKITRKDDEATNFKLLENIEHFDTSSSNNVHIMVDSRIIVKLDMYEDIEYSVKMIKHLFVNQIDENEKGVLDFSSGREPIFSSSTTR